MRLACSSRERSFNSRTLGRVRPVPTITWPMLLPVSIHAPWEGCDMVGRFTPSKSLAFQFTHPGKGATPAKWETSGGNSVSIHAPWEGCDLQLLSFQRLDIFVSIHAPWEGCDKRRAEKARSYPVSIHAPWEGCD